MRVLHYVNQFFGGVGGDDQAEHPPELREETVGPGRLLDNLLGNDGNVVATLICGDKYFRANTDSARDAVREAVEAHKPDVVIAGPAFDSVAYGFACAEVVRAAQDAGVKAVTGMAPENPAGIVSAPDIYIVTTGASPASMADALGNMVKLARKLAADEEIGPADEEGYFAQDVSDTDRSAAQDAIEEELDKGILEVGSRAVGFELTVAGTEDQVVLDEALKQGPVLVSIYKSSCQASKTAFPFFERISQAYPKDRLTVWGVSLDSPRVTASFMRRYGVTFPNLLDGDGYPTAKAYGVKETPTTFLIDQFGEVVWNSVAFEKSEMHELSERVAGLLSEPAVDVLSGTEDVPDSVHG